MWGQRQIAGIYFSQCEENGSCFMSYWKERKGRKEGREKNEKEKKNCQDIKIDLAKKERAKNKDANLQIDTWQNLIRGRKANSATWIQQIQKQSFTKWGLM